MLAANNAGDCSIKFSSFLLAWAHRFYCRNLVTGISMTPECYVVRNLESTPNGTCQEKRERQNEELPSISVQNSEYTGFDLNEN
jgi:hypothetical protein